MAVAVLSLLGLLVSVYLWLWKLGFMGPMVCVSGGCETVQMSEYAMLFGQPVALYGVLGFAALFVTSLVGLRPTWLDRREPTLVLLGLSFVGLAFAAYLSYLEAAKIHAWCQWCVTCAVLILASFVAALVGAIRMPRAVRTP